MAVDYDERRIDPLHHDDSDDLVSPTDRRATDIAIDGDDDPGDGFQLPGADLSGEELRVRVVPKQADEFTCCSCFLVQHRSRIAPGGGRAPICHDCA